MLAHAKIKTALIDIASTFRDHEILITGTSGFLGKVVLGLLIDRYPDFKHLHVLMRPGKGLDATARFEREVLGSPALRPVVERFERARPAVDLASRITVWPGDVGMTGAGLGDTEVRSLVARLGLIINNAGRVDFFPPLDDSLASNVDGVEHLTGLARRTGARVLHVSTCFVCGTADGLIEETEPIVGFYPQRQGSSDTSFRVQDEMAYCRDRVAEIYRTAGIDGGSPQTARRPREVAQRLTALGRQRAGHWGWVNTYTYSKSLGEQVLASQSDVPWTIVRPAIIESSAAFPFPGWIEGGRTAAPLVLMALSGMREWPMRRDAALEVVPVDQVAAAILVAGALLLHGEHQPLYQLASADVNPIHLGPLVRLLHREAHKLRTNGSAAKRPLVQRVVSGGPLARRPRFLSAAQARARRKRQDRRLERMQLFISRTRSILESLRLPGHRRLAGWSSALRAFGLQSSLREQTLEQYLPFVLDNRYVFECENIRAAYALITPEDRARLPWAPEKIDWEYYWTHNQIRGIQKWVQPGAVKDWAIQV